MMAEEQPRRSRVAPLQRVQHRAMLGDGFVPAAFGAQRKKSRALGASLAQLSRSFFGCAPSTWPMNGGWML